MPLSSFLAHLLLEQFSESFVCAVGGWLIAGNAADQIGHLVIKAVRQDGIRSFDNSIANDARLGNTRESRGLAEPCFRSRVKANAFQGLLMYHDSVKNVLRFPTTDQALGRPLEVWFERLGQLGPRFPVTSGTLG